MPELNVARSNRFVAADPDDLARVPENAGALAMLGALASPQRVDEAPPWIVGGFSVGVHPDLVVHFFAIAEATGRPARFVYGRPVLVDGENRLLAYANNMHDLYLRPGRAGCDAAMAHGAEPRPNIGPDWLWINAWPAALPRPDRVGMIAGWLGAVADA
jgi:hypothetical protein